MDRSSFGQLFGHKAVIGMLHLALHDYVRRALDDLEVLEGEGADAVIVENHPLQEDFWAVAHTLDAIRRRGTPLLVGVNVLPNEYFLSIPMAADHGAAFVQLDHVAGTCHGAGSLMAGPYLQLRQQYPQVSVLGGVHPKYYRPVDPGTLQDDIRTGMERADAIVVTGAATGREVPVGRLLEFRMAIGDEYPLVVGAGVTPENAQRQFAFCDAAIVGSYFRGGDLGAPIRREKVREVMDAVRSLRGA